ncbi:Holliday junction branch migration protein RuvA [Domibacillus epiphyticus]|uniref:Holliday junction branch migration complex subunit RuvA n=1 Tax=Domibacillus epiphyticus TaxID=1714355 RepID=A0A1V2A995_9BACI|nr:Holliday junction branch migration protein RuvA [Domibacillus epiphyticus]OMP67563.1 Holliday junction DNA helicase RuvA [Domibacillus epiphyticus]
MYEYVKGIITFIGPEYIVVENNGIGYRLLTPNPFAFSKYEQTNVTIYVYHHVREDAQLLFGFMTLEEKRLFEKLISVSGIGPKGALAVLASGEPSHVVGAIDREDEAYLIKFPGIGKKTARQMILDLKGKLDEVSPEPLSGLFQTENEPAAPSGNAALEEALLALEALGYSAREIKRINGRLEKEEKMSTDEYIRKGLQLLLG